MFIVWLWPLNICIHLTVIISIGLLCTKHSQNYSTLEHTVYSEGFMLLLSTRPSFIVLFLLIGPDITITKWHMPFVRQQLVRAMEETFWKKGGVKFANINLVSNWTAKFQLNELPFKCSRPWLHTFNPEVNLIWSQEPYKGTTHWLIKRTEGRWGEKKKEKRESQVNGEEGKEREKSRYSQAKAEKDKGGRQKGKNCLNGK